MAIIKFSKSGNQIQFIDDFGNVYGTSWQSVLNIKQGTVKQGFTMLMRMPFKVSTQRFGVSPLWDPQNTQGNTPMLPSSNNNVELKDDILTLDAIKNKEKNKPVNDVTDW